MERNRLRAADLTRIALAASLIAVCSWLAVPTTVPFTMQTFAVFAVLSILGGRLGTWAIAAYLLLGAVGAPVFAQFTGGPGILFGATGGYLGGFLLTGLCYRLATARFGESLPVRTAALVLGLGLCYTFGTAWFVAVYSRETGPVTLSAALGWCVVPFLLPDAAKLVLALAVARRVRPYVVREGNAGPL